MLNQLKDQIQADLPWAPLIFQDKLNESTIPVKIVRFLSLYQKKCSPKANVLFEHPAIRMPTHQFFEKHPVIIENESLTNTGCPSSWRKRFPNEMCHLTRTSALVPLGTEDGTESIDEG